MKSLDKKKTKKLDFNDKLYDIWFESLCNGNYQMFQKKIKEMFTQQRTELLEEINKLLIGELVIVKTREPYYYQNKQSIPKEQYEFLLEQRQKLFNLLNKKDE